MSTIPDPHTGPSETRLPCSVVVTVEPRVYREAIGGAIEMLRPHLEVVIVEPGALGPPTARLEAGVVICGQPKTAAITDANLTWVEYRPYDEEPAKICLGGRDLEMHEVGLWDLLTVIDETERLIETSAACAKPGANP